MHGAQDFYAHSNWADEADPTRPVGDANPPGLNLPGPSPVLDLRAGSPPGMPPDLTTGCFVVKDEVPGVAACASRVTHAALNKDRGLIDPATGRATGPTTRPLCTFAYVDALARAGRVDESRRAFEKMLTYANHVGLFSEEIALNGEQIGNFPQSFTHLALIDAAITLDAALDAG